MTGSAGIEALLWAYSQIKKTIGEMPEGSYLMVWGDDVKRNKAYRRLCKLGLTPGWEWDGYTCYGIKKGGDSQG